MAVNLNVYINFVDSAREAMDFYQSIFGGEVYADTFRKFASEEMPVAEADLDKVMHAYLKGDNGIEIMASDAPSGMPHDAGSNISISLSGGDEDEAVLKGYWDKLSGEGGTVTLPFNKAPWGASFGMCTDKFGINWMVNVGGQTQS